VLITENLGEKPQEQMIRKRRDGELGHRVRQVLWLWRALGCGSVLLMVSLVGFARCVVVSPTRLWLPKGYFAHRGAAPPLR
jgi:hypothetical protein